MVSSLINIVASSRLLSYNRGKNRPGGLIQLTIRCDSTNQQHIDDLFLVSLFIVPQGEFDAGTYFYWSRGVANPDVVSLFVTVRFLYFSFTH
jgi:hypothetical protein